jgi:hypothetical protein
VTQAYPLMWPLGFPRTASRTTSRFKTSLPGAVRNVQDEMRRFGNDSGRAVKDVVVSSNVTLMDDRPKDPGVACYFVWDGIQCCIAIDRYAKPEENLQAVALIIEAERAKMRHGGLNIVKAAFRGYASLPPPADGKEQITAPWQDVLGVKREAGLAEARAAYLAKVKTEHPDRGGDSARFNVVVDAWKRAQEALGT